MHPFPYRVARLMLFLAAVSALVLADVSSASQTETWTVVSSPSSDALYEVAYGGNRYIVVGDAILSSENGSEWAEAISPSTTLMAVSFGNGMYVAAGQWIRTETNQICSYTYSGGLLTGYEFPQWYYTYLYTSSDGESFSESEIGSDITVPKNESDTANEMDFSDMTYFDNSFYTVGTVEVHYDEVTTTIVTDPVTGLPEYQYDYFCKHREDMGVVQSIDGADWAFSFADSESQLRAITAGDNTLVAVGEDGTIYTSPDAETWTAQSSGTTEHLHGIAYGDSAFVAVGDAGTILTSPDAETWTAQSSGTAEHLHGIAYGDSSFVAVGDNGTMVRTVLGNGDPEAAGNGGGGCMISTAKGR